MSMLLKSTPLLLFVPILARAADLSPSNPWPQWRGPGADGSATSGVYAVTSFHEKPDRPTAESYLATGRFYWNAGIFAWRSARILEEIGRFQPDLIAGLKDLNRLEAVYPTLPKISIDHAVMEKADRVEVVEADIGLTDVGNWEAFAERYLKKPQGDGAVDSERCLVFSDSADHLVAVFGVSDLVVVRTEDATLVCPRDRAGDLKVLIKQLRERGLERYL